MKKRICSLLLVFLMSCCLLLPAMAAPAAPEITMHAQSPNYPEYSVAIYTVKVDGTNLSATWYMEWLGKTYTISDIGAGPMQDWEPFAGESYGCRQLDSNTFAFIFEGLEYDLDGAYIWCVIEDGHYAVTSQKTRISVGNPNTPPEILSIPAQMTVEQGENAELRCVARSNDGSQLDFLWYETDTGRMEDMRAVNRGTETSDFMFLDTSTVGTRNYLCRVQTSNGGIAYSSIVPVTVTERRTPITTPAPTAAPTDVPPAPTKRPATTGGTQATPVPTAEIVVVQTPVPTQVVEATQAPTPIVDATQAPSQNTGSFGSQTQSAGFPWWGMVLVGAAGAGIGVGTALVLIKKKS